MKMKRSINKIDLGTWIIIGNNKGGNKYEE